MKDLFETPELLPAEMQALLKSYEAEDNDYQSCANLLKECEALGYTFDYYLDAEPINLRPLSVTAHYDVANSAGLDYAYCAGCDAETPDENGECTICGQSH